MAYTVNAVKVMIASPSDVSSERKIIREVIQEWNYINSENSALVLMPIGWETHSVPNLNGRPQEIINRNVLKNCDILIAAFWTRIGSSTGEYVSGTIEEIERHIKEGKRAMLYYSTAPVRLETTDRNQYDKLVEFKNKYMEAGLIESYENLEEFRQIFFRQLSQAIIEDYSVNTINHQSITKLKIPELKLPSQVLLKAAAIDDGSILRVSTFGGLFIQANNMNFTEEGNSRSEAQWDGALNELLSNGFIRDAGMGEVFNVTDTGYDYADKIEDFEVLLNRV